MRSLQVVTFAVLVPFGPVSFAEQAMGSETGSVQCEVWTSEKVWQDEGFLWDKVAFTKQDGQKIELPVRHSGVVTFSTSASGSATICVAGDAIASSGERPLAYDTVLTCFAEFSSTAEQTYEAADAEGRAMILARGSNRPGQTWASGTSREVEVGTLRSDTFNIPAGTLESELLPKCTREMADDLEAMCNEFISQLQASWYFWSIAP